jgi:hypothetical protein
MSVVIGQVSAMSDQARGTTSGGDVSARDELSMRRRKRTRCVLLLSEETGTETSKPELRRIGRWPGSQQHFMSARKWVRAVNLASLIGHPVTDVGQAAARKSRAPTIMRMEKRL